MEMQIFSGEKVVNVTNFLTNEVKITQGIRQASYMTFFVVKDKSCPFFEGDKVVLSVDGINIFTGFIFQKERDEKQIIQVTCYDQLIYLIRNKNSYVFNNMSGSDIIKQIASEYNIELGNICDTNHVISYRIENSQTLLDIIYTALDTTKKDTTRDYILKDVDGKLSLFEYKDLKTDKLFSDKTNMLNYKYKTTIDDDCYNKVSLSFSNNKTLVCDTITVQDDELIKKWGILPYEYSICENITKEDAVLRAENILKMKSKLNRSLSFNIIGDPTLSAGSSIYVDIEEIGDINILQEFTIKKCNHVFGKDGYRLEMFLLGDFICY